MTLLFVPPGAASSVNLTNQLTAPGYIYIGREGTYEEDRGDRGRQLEDRVRQAGCE
jgi:hypothetical protein